MSGGAGGVSQSDVCGEGTGSSCAAHERGSCRGCVKGRCLVSVRGGFLVSAGTGCGLVALVGLGGSVGGIPCPAGVGVQGVLRAGPSVSLCPEGVWVCLSLCVPLWREG